MRDREQDQVHKRRKLEIHAKLLILVIVVFTDDFFVGWWFWGHNPSVQRICSQVIAVISSEKKWKTKNRKRPQASHASKAWHGRAMPNISDMAGRLFQFTMRVLQRLEASPRKVDLRVPKTTYPKNNTNHRVQIHSHSGSMCTLSFSSFSKWIQVALCSVYICL